MNSIRLWSALLLGAVVVGSTTSAEAGLFGRRGSRSASTCCGAPPSCGAPVACGVVGGHYEDRVIERTVYVRETTMETRTVQVTECRAETREREVRCARRVPYQETVTEDYVVMVQQTHMKQIVETVYKPVMETVTQEYTVMVPHQEMRQGYRPVTTCVPTQQNYTVCVDRGGWQERTIQVPCSPYPVRCGRCGGCGAYGGGRCGGCNGCGACPPQMITRTVRCWVPNIVREQVTRTVMVPQTVNQPYNYAITVCTPERRVRQVQVCRTVAEQVTREVPVTSCVPEKRQRTFQVTKYRDEVDVKKVPYTVMVPYTVEKQIQVPVCRVVPKVITSTCRVWVPDCGQGVGPAPAHAPHGAPTAAPPEARSPRAAPTEAPLPPPAPRNRLPAPGVDK
jgi:hypothetical protein